MKYIEDQFKRVKGKEKVRIDINKWSPADIYVTTNNYRQQVSRRRDQFAGSQSVMMHRLVGEGQGPIMFGVSLKKITQTNARLYTVNVDPKTARDQFYKKFLELVPILLICIWNLRWVRIQFRNFAGPKPYQDFRGEVKGDTTTRERLVLDRSI